MTAWWAFEKYDQLRTSTMDQQIWASYSCTQPKNPGNPRAMHAS